MALLYSKGIVKDESEYEQYKYNDYIEICFRGMGLGPIPHMWTQTREVATGFYWDPSPLHPFKGKYMDDEYLRRKGWFCIPINLPRCMFDEKAASRYLKSLHNQNKDYYTFIPISSFLFPFPFNNLFNNADNCWSEAVNLLIKSIILSLRI